jgi:hypothetical protein
MEALLQQRGLFALTTNTLKDVFSLKRSGDLRPIAIGRAVVAEMDRLADADVSPLPHAFVIAISDPDARALDYAKKSLAHELRQAISNHAKFEGYELQGEPHVDIVIDRRVERGTCKVTPHQRPLQKTAPTPEPTEVLTPVAALTMDDRSTHPLDSASTTIGRQSTCGVVIADPSVSRVHAEIVRRDGGWWLIDKGSTNGTTLNGAPVVKPIGLNHGDSIVFGSVAVRFESA